MAKTRMINTRFWNDNFIVGLNPLDRYLFLYFLTNEHTNISGIYELPMRTLAFETGIDKEMLPKMIKRLEGRVHYLDGWIFIKNFQKHQATTSEKVKRGIEIETAKIPNKIKDKIDKLSKKKYPIDRVSNPIIYPNENENENEKLEQSSVWLLEDKLKDMEKEENSYLDIIATFIREKPVLVENSRQLSEVISRYCRVAKKLAGAYTNKQIFTAADKIKEDNKGRE